MPYELRGAFVECCDCFTVCPCWVSDVPDEDHCSGLYLWSLGEGSHLDGVPLAGMQVAAASFHAVRAGGQAMFFIDAGGDAALARRIYDVFAGRQGGAQIEGLRKLLGVYLGHVSATIDVDLGKTAFTLSIAVDDRRIAVADGIDKVFDQQSRAMTLRDTALADRLGLGDRAATVQRMGELTLDVAALPGGPLALSGRWGARSKFHYAHAGDPPEETDDVPAAEAAADERD